MTDPDTGSPRVYPCQASDDGVTLCGAPAVVQVIQIDTETRVPLRQVGAYACLAHSVSMAMIVAAESGLENPTVQLIELAGAEFPPTQGAAPDA
jgi:hypothetical protein